MVHLVGRLRHIQHRADHGITLLLQEPGQKILLPCLFSDVQLADRVVELPVQSVLHVAGNFSFAHGRKELVAHDFSVR